MKSGCSIGPCADVLHPMLHKMLGCIASTWLCLNCMVCVSVPDLMKAIACNDACPEADNFAQADAQLSQLAVALLQAHQVAPALHVKLELPLAPADHDCKMWQTTAQRSACA